MAGEEIVQPSLGRAILREDDHPFVVPLALGAQGLIEPREQFLGLGIGPGALLCRPILEIADETPLLVAQSLKDRRGAPDDLVFGRLVQLVVCVVFVNLRQLTLQTCPLNDALLFRRPSDSPQGLLVLCQRVEECRRTREQALLQQLQDELSAEADGIVVTRLLAELAVSLELPMRRPLGFRVGHLDRLELAFRESLRAVPVQDLGLEAMHEHDFQLATVRFPRAGESLVVQELEEGHEALDVAIVGRRCEKQFVLEVGRKGSNGFRSIRVDRRSCPRSLGRRCAPRRRSGGRNGGDRPTRPVPAGPHA